ncbi:hypothetical protein QBC34DRAFT_104576 [Podospora aff. communis PSN243]|uniref:Reverse transcriptase zinc-binding domain-containing protein n=1 Tax=Podospora aff. communis PSN243 TaxID=3040156 RepID=A0AAV9H7D6_9PEZI|nr:hypothetical protein QBC34DRAFT_104576 [Podospora aff. communis PSN243]
MGVDSDSSGSKSQHLAFEEGKLIGGAGWWWRWAIACPMQRRFLVWSSVSAPTGTSDLRLLTDKLQPAKLAITYGVRIILRAFSIRYSIYPDPRSAGYTAVAAYNRHVVDGSPQKLHSRRRFLHTQHPYLRVRREVPKERPPCPAGIFLASRQDRPAATNTGQRQLLFTPRQAPPRAEGWTLNRRLTGWAKDQLSSSQVVYLKLDGDVANTAASICRLWLLSRVVASILVPAPVTCLSLQSHRSDLEPDGRASWRRDEPGAGPRARDI